MVFWGPFVGHNPENGLPGTGRRPLRIAVGLVAREALATDEPCLIEYLGTGGPYVLERVCIYDIICLKNTSK